MLWIIGAVLVVCTLVVVSMMLRALVGYEDEKGFHAGEEPHPDQSDTAVTEMDQVMHRALVDAGMAPLDEYVERFTYVDNGVDVTDDRDEKR